MSASGTSDLKLVKVADGAADKWAYLSRQHPRKTSLATELAYFRKHKKRMRYMELQSKGLMIGSGVVEAACKTLVAQRLKQSGMRWSVSGAQAILTPRDVIRATASTRHGRSSQPPSKSMSPSSLTSSRSSRCPRRRSRRPSRHDANSTLKSRDASNGGAGATPKRRRRKGVPRI